MKKALTFCGLSLVAISLATATAHANIPLPEPDNTFYESPGSCPNMNGHFKHSQFLASADIYVTQVGCATMAVQLKADIVGQSYDESYSSPLDGVTREVPSKNSNEKDYVAGSFHGDTLVLVIQQVVTGSDGKSTTTTSEIEGLMLNANEIQVTEGTLGAQGQLSGSKTYDFSRVQ